MSTNRYVAPCTNTLSHQRDYCECSIMVLTETWLMELTLDTDTNLDGFQLRRAYRTAESGKRKGGGLAGWFVNDRWSNSNITVKEQVCSKDIKLLAVSMRPYYLLREFTQVIVFAVYIPPSANTDAAYDVLHSVTSSLQTQHPQAPFLISGTSIMPLCPPLCPHSHSMSPATPETIKHLTYFMPTARRHTTHPPSLLTLRLSLRRKRGPLGQETRRS